MARWNTSRTKDPRTSCWDMVYLFGQWLTMSCIWCHSIVQHLLPNRHSAMFVRKQHVTSGKEIRNCWHWAKFLMKWLFFTKHKLVCTKQIQNVEQTLNSVFLILETISFSTVRYWNGHTCTCWLPRGVYCLMISKQFAHSVQYPIRMEQSGPTNMLRSKFCIY